MSRVRENRMHGSKRRGLETERTCSATVPAPDPTGRLVVGQASATENPVFNTPRRYGRQAG
ncbi:hypothetical protein C4B68_00590 [Streptomyces dengpaensis]|uniref:Uncharacterized protein n=1 Tax=Streptomyces dengpaensis TaxID=2049881 RepID=A0ABM6SK50_9ACTN|nr:hypothetical protein C4B68_00590 [Streptomyces dengpaensis]